MTGISSVTVNNMVDDTGDGISGTPYNKTFMQSLINDLIATALPLDGSQGMTGALQELFIGLIRKLNPNGTAHIYEYAGGLLATTTSPTGNGFQQAWTYNVPLATTTIPPTVNNWGGRDILDFCVLVQFLDTGVFEIWFAPSAAAGAAPVWTRVFGLDSSTGFIITNSVGARASFARNVIESNFEKYVNNANLPPYWSLLQGGAPNVGQTTIANYACTYFNTATTATPIAAMDIGFNPASGRTALFGARMAISATGTAANWGIYLTANGSTNNYAAIYFNTANLVCETSPSGGGAVSSTILVANYVINTFYDVWFILSSTSISAYLGNNLIGTWGTNLPSGLLRPGIWYVNGNGLIYSYFSRTFFSPDY